MLKDFMPSTTVVILVAIVALAICAWRDDDSVEGYHGRRHLWRHRRRHHFRHGPRPYGRRWYSYAPGGWAPVFVASGTGALVANQLPSQEDDEKKEVEDDRHGDLNKSLKTVLLGVAIVLGVSIILNLNRGRK